MSASRPLRLALAALAALGLAACGRGEKLPQAPLEADSRFCDGKALYRTGAILFCADRDARFAATITYSLEGNATGTFARELDDVVAVARCLTGRPFAKIGDGALKISIDNKIETPGKNGLTHHGAGGMSLNAHFGAARTGSITVEATNGRAGEVGERLQAGMWRFLGLSSPRALAVAERAFPDPRADAPTMREIADGARFCEADSALRRRGDTVFCAPQKHRWPPSIGYAVIGDVTGLDAVIAASAVRASRLTGVRFEPSRKPALLVILSERKLTKDSLGRLLADSQVTPPDAYAIEQLPEDEGNFKSTMTKAMGGMVGKPVAGVIADWMTSESARYDWSDTPNRTSVIGLHNRDRIDTEMEIGTQFLAILKVTPPSYDPASACDTGG